MKILKDILEVILICAGAIVSWIVFFAAIGLVAMIINYILHQAAQPLN